MKILLSLMLGISFLFGADRMACDMIFKNIVAKKSEVVRNIGENAIVTIKANGLVELYMKECFTSKKLIEAKKPLQKLEDGVIKIINRETMI